MGLDDLGLTQPHQHQHIGLVCLSSVSGIFAYMCLCVCMAVQEGVLAGDAGAVY